MALDSVKTKSYGWGQCGNFQLGAVETDDDGCLLEPTHLEKFDEYILQDAAIGTKHSLFLSKFGLLSVGCNDCGQLGRVGNGSFPALVDGLAQTNIIAIAVGEHHSLALSSSGSLYSWGDNSYGQLGRPVKSQPHIPSCVEFPAKCQITRVACGANHCVALASNGAVYTWGSNHCGQLGHGTCNNKVPTPVDVASVRSLDFVNIYSGSYHSFALTSSGALFGWGQNSNGQLGIGNTDSQVFPVCCRALRQQNVRHVSCGQSHTAVLTQNGGVFTFGAGSHGQLGHNVAQDEVLPKKIQELMGSTVTQISCGRLHTLALVPSSGRVYSFGLGAYGQLGLSDTNKRCAPCNVPGSWWRSGFTGSSSNHCVKLIHAGADSSISYVEEKEYFPGPPIDQRVVISRQIRLNSDLISKVVNATDTSDPVLGELIDQVFKTPSIWNGAFLKQDPDNGSSCSSTNHGIDLDLAREQLSRLSTCASKAVFDKINSCVEVLIHRLHGKIPDVESLRVFLLLPFLPIFGEPTKFLAGLIDYCECFVRLDTVATRVMDKWFWKIDRRHFKHYLFTHKNVVKQILLTTPSVTHLEMFRNAMQLSLSVMHTLYQVNETEYEEHKLPCMDFYIPEITEKVDIRLDYINWFGRPRIKEDGQPVFAFCRYPFVFDALAKTILLHQDALIQMQQAIDEAHRRNIINIFSRPDIDPVHPCLVITISRDKIVQDTLASLQNQGSADLKKPLKVHFKGEEAVDEGGVKKEFFLLLLKEVLDLKYGMFQFYEESRLLWFNSGTFEDDMGMYYLIGLMCGLAIYNGTIIDLPFPLALYKKLLGKRINLDDMRELDPHLGKSLQQLLDYEDDDVEEVFALTFSISINLVDHVVSKDLIPNGSNIPVTNDNRVEYVQEYISYIFNHSVDRMFSSFDRGFHKVCGSQVLGFFHPLELQAMIIGNEDYDWNELEKNCVYKGEFSRHHPTIDYFWEVFHDLSHAQKKEFLRFLTGCDRIPIQGMKVLKIIIQPVKVSEEYLPVAHTCFNLLDLPVQYSSIEKLRAKLIAAIENAEGFGIV